MSERTLRIARRIVAADEDLGKRLKRFSRECDKASLGNLGSRDGMCLFLYPCEASGLLCTMNFNAFNPATFDEAERACAARLKLVQDARKAWEKLVKLKEAEGIPGPVQKV